jgi:hypothetical protein
MDWNYFPRENGADSTELNRASIFAIRCTPEQRDSCRPSSNSQPAASEVAVRLVPGLVDVRHQGKFVSILQSQPSRSGDGEDFFSPGPFLFHTLSIAKAEREGGDVRHNQM